MTADHPTRSPDSPDHQHGERGTRNDVYCAVHGWVGNIHWVSRNHDQHAPLFAPQPPRSPDSPDPWSGGGIDFGKREVYPPGSRSSDSVRTPPEGLLPVRARGKHEIEAAGGWVVACGAYGEYGCMDTAVRDYIVDALNGSDSVRTPDLDVERLGLAIAKHWHDHPTSGYSFGHCASEVAAEYARLVALHPASPPQEGE
jgi:hypothetical protein